MYAKSSHKRPNPATGILLFFLGFLIPLCVKGNAPGISLDSCLHWTEINLRIFQQDALSEEILKNRIKSLNTAYIPQLDLDAFGGFVEGIPNFGNNGQSAAFRFGGSLTLRQTLWDGGTTYREKQAARTQAAIEQEDLETRLRNIRTEVGNAFFGLLLLQEQEKLLDRQKKILQDSRNIARTAVSNGAGLPNELDQVELALLELEQEQAEICSGKEAYAEFLGQMTGRDFRSAVLLEPELDPGSDTRIENRPEWLSLELQKELISRNAGGIGRFLPQVDLLGSGIYTAPQIRFPQDSWNHILAAGLSLSWSLSSSVYASGYGKKRMEMEKRKIEDLQQVVHIRTQSELLSKRAIIAKWDTLLEKDRHIVALREKIRKNAQTRYDNGALEMEKLLQAVSNESRAVAQSNLHRIERLAEIFRYRLASGTISKNPLLP